MSERDEKKKIVKKELKESIPVEETAMEVVENNDLTPEGLKRKKKKYFKEGIKGMYVGETVSSAVIKTGMEEEEATHHIYENIKKMSSVVTNLFVKYREAKTKAIQNHIENVNKDILGGREIQSILSQAIATRFVGLSNSQLLGMVQARHMAMKK